MAEPSLEVIADRVATLNTSLSSLSTDVRKFIEVFPGQLHTVEMDNVSAHATLDAKIVATNERTRDEFNANLAKALEGIQKTIEPIPTLVAAYRVLTWIAGILGASVLALIWAIVTGRASIAFHP